MKMLFASCYFRNEYKQCCKSLHQAWIERWMTKMLEFLNDVISIVLTSTSKSRIFIPNLVFIIFIDENVRMHNIIFSGRIFIQWKNIICIYDRIFVKNYHSIYILLQFCYYLSPKIPKKYFSRYAKLNNSQRLWNWKLVSLGVVWIKN